MPHRQKATMEEKVQLARACINGEMSVCEASLRKRYRWLQWLYIMKIQLDCMKFIMIVVSVRRF